MRLSQAVLLFLIVTGCQPHPDEADILAVQMSRIAAMTSADPAALDRFLADDLVYIHTTGQVDSKQTLQASLTSGRVVYHAIAPHDSTVRIYGDVAIVTGRADMEVSAGGRQFEFGLAFTEVYRRDGRDWRLASWQSTRLPDQ